MKKIQVDEEVYRMLEFGRDLTGWTHSQVIAKAAQVKRDKLLEEAEALRGLAELAPPNPEPPSIAGLVHDSSKPIGMQWSSKSPTPAEVLDAVEEVGEMARTKVAEMTEASVSGKSPDWSEDPNPLPPFTEKGEPSAAQERQPLDAQPGPTPSESGEESVEAPRTSAARPKPRDILDMIHAGVLKVSSKWHLALSHGREVTFTLSKDGEFVNEDDRYDTPNKAVKEYGFTKSAWDGLRDKSDKSLREYWQGWQSA